MISIKNNSDIQKMRKAGQIVAQTLKLLQQLALPGATTKELDKTAEDFILSQGAIPSFKNYGGFPAATCMSVDDVVVHGIPSDRPLKSGDILSVDVGALIDGFHGDAARTFLIGDVSSEKRKLVEITEKCFFLGLEHCLAGNRLGDVSHAIQTCAERYGYSVVRTMVGHGIGRKLHEDPSIPNYGSRGGGVMLKKGYALAIEPMINMGTFEVDIDKSDGWTCRTRDGLPSAHYENTVIITDGQPEVLTLY